jgi:predicted ATP-grasp superfamily ATP-dependent carboligase
VVNRTGTTTVVITGTEHFGGLAALRALALAGHETWIATVRPRAYGALSRLPAGNARVPDPASDKEGFVAGVAALAERVDARVVLPGTDLALAALAGGRDAFPSDVAVGVCPPERVDLATTKTALAELAKAAGFDVPPTHVVGRNDVSRIEGAFPMVVKPLRSDVEGANGTLVHGGASRVEDARELRRIADELGAEACLVQPYLNGELVAVAGVAWDGAVVAEVHQVSHRIWPPYCGGSSYAATIEPDSERGSKVRKLLAEVGWSGIFQVQLLRCRGVEFLIDLNPRFYGTLALALAAGVNMPALWVDLLRGVEPAPRPPFRVGVHFRAHLKDARALVAAAKAGAWREVAKGLPPRPRACHPVFSWRDPLPVLAGSTRVACRATALVAGTLRPSHRPGSLDKTSEKS